MRYKKMITAAAVAGASALALAGCSGTSGDSGGSKTVTMWIYPVIADEAAHKSFWDKTVPLTLTTDGGALTHGNATAYGPNVDTITLARFVTGTPTTTQIQTGLGVK